MCTMLPLEEAIKEENVEFHWGLKRGNGMRKKDAQFYESFTYDGIEYFLYDCVYMWHDDQLEPDIGKLVKIWETSGHIKMVKVVWFFRPVEIKNWLGGVKPLENEIFLASGEGKGLFNLNPLEAIAGKCSVVCTSKDKRNPQVSEEEMRMAHYVFSHTFEVGTCRILDTFADIITGIEVKHFFNRKTNRNLTTHELKASFKEKNALFRLSHGKSMKDDNSVICQNPAAGLKFPAVSNDSVIRPLKKRTLQITSDTRNSYSKNMGKQKVALHRKFASTSEKASLQLEQHKVVGRNSKMEDAAKQPGVDTRKWFKQLSWEEKMQSAQEKGTLVLLENLDPCYTSSEVEDIVWHAFNLKVDAKMVQHSVFSNPHYGQAFVIFKSKDATESAISDLNRRCLMLSNGRPVVGRRGSIRDTAKAPSFVGHLAIDKLRCQKQHVEMRNAVSTSHYSQPNTVEHEMAFEWRGLLEKSNLCWGSLYKRQGKEIKDLRSQLKTQPGGLDW